MAREAFSLDIDSLLMAYRSGRFTPVDMLDLVDECIDTELRDSHNIWITRFDRDMLQPYLDNLAQADIDSMPLYGIPFAVKDNIDVADADTTAACEAFRYRAQAHACAVQRLVDAGAIPVGKTNLDQFATGLVGTRSPYGAACCSLDRDYIAGGSSSGSALAVALGLVSFALGTDTAGSGRIPAAFNNLFGLKPTRGLISTRGVVPACRTLDCVSVFSVCAQDAGRVMEVCAGHDDEEPYSCAAPSSAGGFSPHSFRFGVPRDDQLEFFGDTEAQALFQESVAALEELGGEKMEIDFSGFRRAACLLYEGPWVSERTLATQPLIDEQPQALLPVTRAIIQSGHEHDALSAFAAQYELERLRAQTARTWHTIDLLLTPTAGTQFTLAEVAAEPVQRNTELGYYTNYMNLLDLCACAVPAGFKQDGLAFGVTLSAPAWHDQALLALADRLHRARVGHQGAMSMLPLPANAGFPMLPPGWTRIVVCGAHMSGLPLNHQLTDRGGYLVERTHTAAAYRFFALPGGPPQRPGLVRDEGGAAIEVEVWALPLAQYGSFVAGIPAPLGIGTLELASGEWLQGFICEQHAVAAATEITRLGGWRAWLAKAEQVGR